MTRHFDITIIGSGFGGSLLALIARRLGRSVVMAERGRHPRFAIGESSTPLANLLLEQLAARYGLPRIAALSKWGTWQKHHPEISCGLKRGFTFYHHNFGRHWSETPDRNNELLVAASPRDEIADTHWYRSQLDHFLVREAQAAGVEFEEETCTSEVSCAAGGLIVRATRHSQTIEFTTNFLIDATGPRSSLQKLLGVEESQMEFMPATAGLYSHFQGVQRMDESSLSSPTTPYPIDDAAVHHVFPGGWIWILRFNNRITSAGVAATKQVSEQFGFADGQPGWIRLLDQLPTVGAQFEKATAILPFTYASPLGFRAETITGPGWAMLPSAAGFIDPLLSTGFPLTLAGIKRLAGIIEHHWGSDSFAKCVESYAVQTRLELRTAERLVAALYGSMDDFPLFVRISLLYFAAASYSEAALRLDRNDLTGASFLLEDHPRFGPAMRDCLKSVLTRSGERPAIMKAICDAIDAIDVAGLGDFSRRNWYPAKAEDLLAAAAKLDSPKQAIQAMLDRTGFGTRGDSPLHRAARVP